METSHIIHEGKISNINDEIVEVTIESKSACASCHAGGACTAADKSTRHINIKNSPAYRNLHVGDDVVVEGDLHSGLKAVLYAYVIPFILMLITLMVASELTGNNLVSGLLALGITVPYYTVVYFNRKKFEKEFSFFIKTEA